MKLRSKWMWQDNARPDVQKGSKIGQLSDSGDSDRVQHRVLGQVDGRLTTRGYLGESQKRAFVLPIHIMDPASILVAVTIVDPALVIALINTGPVRI
jgi:hypothetical protein